MSPLQSTNSEFVTVICSRIEPRYEEVVMSRSEFQKFNKAFKLYDEEYFEIDLLEEFKFKDWETGTLGDDLDERRYYFRAYSGNVIDGSDDIVSTDNDQSWDTAFNDKPLKRRAIDVNGRWFGFTTDQCQAV